MASDLYYQKLKNLVVSGRLSIRLIIAPSRTNSSLVEHVIGNSPDIDDECHEPFLGDRHEGFNPDHGYQEIYDSIGGEKFENSDDVKSVIVKEMSHCIAVNNEYERLSGIVSDPVIFLMRNPLLSVESRIRRILTTVDMRENTELQRYLLDEIAKTGGDVDQLTQSEMLDFLARNNGYDNWRNLLEKKLYAERDYKFFTGILSANEHRLNADEFERLAEEEKYFREQGRSSIVVDTTDLRADPDEQLREICTRLGVRFSGKMLHWKKRSVDFHTEQTQEFEKLWYDSLLASTHIKPPTEIPPTLAMFPEFIQQYLRESSLPVYAELSKIKMLKRELRHELNEREFDVPITEGNLEILQKTGVVSGSVASKKYSVKLRDIDPIYASTNEPSLLDIHEFLADNSTYTEELKIIRGIVLEGGEPTSEYKNRC